MNKQQSTVKRPVNRRAFLKSGMLAGSVAALGTGLMEGVKPAWGQSSRLEEGDMAILRFLALAELIESDLWIQYAELGGIGDNAPIEVNPNQVLNTYQAALSNLDADGPQYITSNTIDEISHATFLNGYLESKGGEPVNLDEFRTLQGSTATGAQDIGRLTNLMHLNVDTSWYIRYRSQTNPDFGATFPQPLEITNRPAIPRTDADLNGTPAQIQVIANTAAFHFGYIEQGGSSLYATMAQKARSAEVLEIILGIGADEVCHFLEWVDFAGNGVQPSVAPVSYGGLTFPNFFTQGPLFQPSLIFPVPCEFISPSLPHCAVIRPLTDKFAGAVATIASFTADGLFLGQSPAFLKLIQEIAWAADAAQRHR